MLSNLFIELLALFGIIILSSSILFTVLIVSGFLYLLIKGWIEVVKEAKK